MSSGRVRVSKCDEYAHVSEESTLTENFVTLETLKIRGLLMTVTDPYSNCGLFFGSSVQNWSGLQDHSLRASLTWAKAGF